MPRVFLPMIIRPPQVKRVTWNPSDAGAHVLLSNGNLTATNNSNTGGARATVAHNVGQYYCEFVVSSLVGGANSPAVGVATASLNIATSGTWYSTTLGGAGNPANDGISLTHFFCGTGADLGIGNLADFDVVGLYTNVTAGKAWLARNGTIAFGGNPVAGTNESFSFDAGLALFPAYRGTNTCVVTARFRSDHWGHSSLGFAEW